MPGVKGRSGRKPSTYRTERLHVRTSEAGAERLCSLVSELRAESEAELITAFCERVPVEVARRALEAYRANEAYVLKSPDQERAERVLSALSPQECDRLLRSDLGAIVGGLNQMPPTLSEFALTAMVKMGEMSGLSPATVRKLAEIAV